MPDSVAPRNLASKLTIKVSPPGSTPQSKSRPHAIQTCTIDRYLQGRDRATPSHYKTRLEC
jgi:hypothetical protein